MMESRGRLKNNPEDLEKHRHEFHRHDFDFSRSGFCRPATGVAIAVGEDRHGKSEAKNEQKGKFTHRFSPTNVNFR